METNPNRVFFRGTHIFWVMSDRDRVMSYENNKSKQPLNVSIISTFVVFDNPPHVVEDLIALDKEGRTHRLTAS